MCCHNRSASGQPQHRHDHRITALRLKRPSILDRGGLADCSQCGAAWRHRPRQHPDRCADRTGDGDVIHDAIRLEPIVLTSPPPTSGPVQGIHSWLALQLRRAGQRGRARARSDPISAITGNSARASPRTSRSPQSQIFGRSHCHPDSLSLSVISLVPGSRAPARCWARRSGVGPFLVVAAHNWVRCASRRIWTDARRLRREWVWLSRR